MHLLSPSQLKVHYISRNLPPRLSCQRYICFIYKAPTICISSGFSYIFGTITIIKVTQNIQSSSTTSQTVPRAISTPFNLPERFRYPFLSFSVLVLHGKGDLCSGRRDRIKAGARGKREGQALIDVKDSLHHVRLIVNLVALACTHVWQRSLVEREMCSLA